MTNVANSQYNRYNKAKKSVIFSSIGFFVALSLIIEANYSGNLAGGVIIIVFVLIPALFVSFGITIRGTYIVHRDIKDGVAGKKPHDIWVVRLGTLPIFIAILYLMYCIYHWIYIK